MRTIRPLIQVEARSFSSIKSNRTDCPAFSVNPGTANSAGCSKTPSFISITSPQPAILLKSFTTPAYRQLLAGGDVLHAANINRTAHRDTVFIPDYLRDDHLIAPDGHYRVQFAGRPGRDKTGKNSYHRRNRQPQNDIIHGQVHLEGACQIYDNCTEIYQHQP